ncbi:MAG: PPDK N protein [Anaerolineales bacterium]|jgi:pyruvate,water dikinase|nr:PPDK N protein [Anaerolineales bacterium]
MIALLGASGGHQSAIGLQRDQSEMGRHILSLQEITQDDVQRCGGKATSLGELTRAGARVPPGFCIVAEALSYVVASNSLGDRITRIAASLDFENYNEVEEKTAHIRSLITSAALPGDLERDILEHYRALVSGDNKFVAVRSSVAVKDSPISSFPGMMDTYHYVLGEAEVLEKIRECWASLWTARAAFARHQKNILQDRGLIACVIQLMVNADTAGVLFTANPITKATNEVVIESNWGLGESVVSGRSMNDFYVLDKDSLAIRQKKIAHKTVMVTMDGDRGSGRKEQPVPAERATAPTLSEVQLVELGEVSKKIEQHFNFNADIEWAYQHGALYILQTRRIRYRGE